jgi:sodium/potassium/calcium exchanger 6
MTRSAAEGAARRKRPRFSFRAFYISTLLLCALALLSLTASEVVRYQRGAQYGVRERQLVAQLDSNRAHKTDQEARLPLQVVLNEPQLT